MGDYAGGLSIWKLVRRDCRKPKTRCWSAIRDPNMSETDKQSRYKIAFVTALIVSCNRVPLTANNFSFGYSATKALRRQPDAHTWLVRQTDQPRPFSPPPCSPARFVAGVSKCSGKLFKAVTFLNGIRY